MEELSGGVGKGQNKEAATNIHTDSLLPTHSSELHQDFS